MSQLAKENSAIPAAPTDDRSRDTQKRDRTRDGVDHVFIKPQLALPERESTKAVSSYPGHTYPREDWSNRFGCGMEKLDVGRPVVWVPNCCSSQNRVTWATVRLFVLVARQQL